MPMLLFFTLLLALILQVGASPIPEADLEQSQAPIANLESTLEALKAKVHEPSPSDQQDPVPSDSESHPPSSLEFAPPAAPPAASSLPGLPLKVHVHADATCASSRTHLYYLPVDVCIGPLYHPAGSVRPRGDLPDGCTMHGYVEGYCRGEEVQMVWPGNRESAGKALKGPYQGGICVSMGLGRRVGKEEEERWEGVNSLVVRCRGGSR